MRKIKKMEFVQIRRSEQKQILGGCYECGCCEVCTCFGTGGGTGGGGGSKPNPSNHCSSHCMPGDNADFANWLGTKMAESLFS